MSLDALHTRQPIARPPSQRIKDRIEHIGLCWILYEPDERREGDVEALS